MSAQEYSHPPASNAPLWIMTLICFILGAAFLWTIRADIPIGMPSIVIQTATTGTAPVPTRGGMVISLPPVQPDQRAVPTAIPGIAGNEATATAQYNEAVQKSQNGAVVLPANDPQPVQFIQQQADERQPAGDNAPTAEPVVENAPVVDIQKTHECKHGQVWTDAGCKNPDNSTFGSKSRP